MEAVLERVFVLSFPSLGQYFEQTSAHGRNRGSKMVWSTSDISTGWKGKEATLKWEIAIESQRRIFPCILSCPFTLSPSSLSSLTIKKYWADLQKTLKVYPVDFNSHILEASKSVMSGVPGGAELRREEKMK